MPEYGLAQQAASRVASRIESQTESLRVLVARVERLTETNVMHARLLGFHEPPAPGNQIGSTPTAVTTSLDDAIRELTRAIDNLDGSMNLFN